MVYRKGELSTMDRQWPHQVALPAYRCLGHNYRTIHFFCEGLSLFPRTHAFRCDAAEMLVFSFAVRAHAHKFLDRFGGELLDPAARSRWPVTRPRPTDFSAEQRVRYGLCINCDD